MGGRRSDPVVLVRDGTVPHGFECLSVALHDDVSILHDVIHETTVAREEAESDQSIVEDPQVVTWKEQVRRQATREPPDIFAGRKVLRRARVLVADVHTDGLRDNAGTTHDDSAAYSVR